METTNHANRAHQSERILFLYVNQLPGDSCQRTVGRESAAHPASMFPAPAGMNRKVGCAHHLGTVSVEMTTEKLER